MSETVVFIHGIWGNRAAFFPLAHHVKGRGYKTRYFDYNSVAYNPARNAAKLATYLEKLNADTIHLVAHSLGGLVLKHYMHYYDHSRIGKVIMVATPLNGSNVAKLLNKNDFTKLILGRATERGLLGDVPPWPKDQPLGMIAGNLDKGFGTVAERVATELGEPKLFSTASDGTVGLEETMSDEVTHRIEVNQSHTAMLMTKDVARAVSCYLKQGNFDHL